MTNDDQQPKPTPPPTIKSISDVLADLDRRGRQIPAPPLRPSPRDNSWKGGDCEQPWIRDSLMGGPKVKATCPFCGHDQLAISATDDSADARCIEVYCGNGNCDAREIAIVVLKDGTGNSQRPDIAALRDRRR